MALCRSWGPGDTLTAPVAKADVIYDDWPQNGVLNYEQANHF